jgi:hypothetical protein
MIGEGEVSIADVTMSRSAAFQSLADVFLCCEQRIAELNNVTVSHRTKQAVT